MSNPWELIRSRQLDAAVAEYTRRYQAGNEIPSLNNRGIAYLLMGNPAAALADFRQSLSSDPRHAGAFAHAMAGVCCWHLGHPEEAVAAWRAGLAAPYADAAGGVELPALLLYAGCRLKDPALQTEARGLLKKLWRNHLRRVQRRKDRPAPTPADLVHPGLIAWPGAIVPFLLGEMGTDGLMNAVELAGNDILHQRRQCQAHFYIGVRAAIEGDPAASRANMAKSAASDRGELEPEWYLARCEVARDQPPP